MRNSPLHCVLSLQTLYSPPFPPPSPCMKISSPSNKPTCYVLMRLIIISRVRYALRFPFSCSHTEFITWGVRRCYVNRWHSSFYNDILQSMCEVYHIYERDKEYIIQRYRAYRTVTFMITFAFSVLILKMFIITLRLILTK